MTGYLARLVYRAQALEAVPLASAAAPPPEEAHEIEDPFETIGEPLPLDPASPPPQRRSQPARDATPVEDIAPDLPFTAPARQPVPPAEGAAPPPERPLAATSRRPDPEVAARPAPIRPPAPAPEATRKLAEPSSPPQEQADAFMRAALLPRLLAEPPPAAPRELETAPAHTPPTPSATEEHGRAEPEPAPALAGQPLVRLEPPSDELEPESETAAGPVVSIGRLTVTVEPPPQRPRDVVVTRTIRVAAPRDSRSARTLRPRFGLAQS